MKKICVALTLLMMALVTTACTGSTETDVPPVTSTVTATVTVTPAEPIVPDAETSAAWELRRDKIVQLMTADELQKPAGGVVLQRSETGEITQVYISHGDRTNHNMSVFFEEGDLDDVIYVNGAGEHSTWLCEFVPDESVTCPMTDEESARFFEEALPIFDTYAKAIFGSKYRI